MGQIKKLIEIIENIENLDEELTIYASEPWRKDSKSMVALEPEDGSIPQEAEQNNLVYFLEVFLLKEVLDGLGDLKLDKKIEKIIDYAINDV